MKLVIVFYYSFMQFQYSLQSLEEFLFSHSFLLLFLCGAGSSARGSLRSDIPEHTYGTKYIL